METRKTTECLGDSVLLSIARGEIPEPALSHYLGHLDECLDCCKRSMALEPPRRPLRELAKQINRKQASTLEVNPNWKQKILAMGPLLGKPIPDSIGPSEPPKQFGPFLIEGILGEGRASVVYQAFDPEVRRKVALKVLRPEVAARPGMTQSFLEEARALAGVRDPYLVVLHSYGRDPQPHITMEFLEGRTVADALSEGPFEPQKALKIIRDIASGLDALHKAGIIHRDIKPANILLRKAKGAEEPILLDLGLSGEGNTKAGTPGYIAPEIIQGAPPDPATDMFSLGVLLRVMAVGGDSRQISRKVPPAILHPFIQALMDSHPEKRPNAAELVQKIDAFLAPPKPATWPVYLAASVIVLLVVALGWLLTSPPVPVSPQSPVETPERMSLLKPDQILEGTELWERSQIFVLSEEGLIARELPGMVIRIDRLDAPEKTKEIKFPFQPTQIALRYPYLAGAGFSLDRHQMEVVLFDISRESTDLLWKSSPFGSSIFMLDWANTEPALLGIGSDNKVQLVEVKAGVVQMLGKPMEAKNNYTFHKPSKAIWEPKRLRITTSMPPGGIASIEFQKPKPLFPTPDKKAEGETIFAFKELNIGPAMVEWHPSGDRFVAASSKGQCGLFLNKLIRVNPNEYWKPTTVIVMAFDFSIENIKWVDDNRVALLAAGTAGTPIRVYDPTDWANPLLSLDTGSSRTVQIDSAPQKGWFAALAKDGSVRIWKWKK